MGSNQEGDVEIQIKPKLIKDPLNSKKGESGEGDKQRKGPHGRESGFA